MCLVNEITQPHRYDDNFKIFNVDRKLCTQVEEDFPHYIS